MRVREDPQDILKGSEEYGQLKAEPRFGRRKPGKGIMILLSSHSQIAGALDTMRRTQWGQLGEILGGVRVPWSLHAISRLIVFPFSRGAKGK